MFFWSLNIAFFTLKHPLNPPPKKRTKHVVLFVWSGCLKKKISAEKLGELMRISSYGKMRLAPGSQFTFDQPAAELIQYAAYLITTKVYLCISTICYNASPTRYKLPPCNTTAWFNISPMWWEWQWFRVPSTHKMKIMACVSIAIFQVIHFEMLLF